MVECKICGTTIILHNSGSGYYFCPNCQALRDITGKHPLTPVVPTSPPLSEEIIKEVENLRDILLAKNADYGNTSQSSPVLAPDMSADMAIRCRMSDKIARLSTLFSGKKPRVDESIEDTLRDLAGYSILLLINLRNNKKDS